jgi:hypothetical protein
MRLRLASTALALALMATGAAAQETQTHFYLRAWPDLLFKFDPRTDQVVATLQNKHGVCHDATLAQDRKHAFLVTGQRTFVEVVDLEKMELVDEHLFRDDGFLVRIEDVKEQPGGERWFVKLERLEKKLDHFVVQDPQWVDYDLVTKKTDKRSKELPKAIRRGAQPSPDGTKWHVLSKDLLVIDPKTLEEEAKIELSKPLYSGLGAISVRGEDLFDRRNPHAYRFLYTMRDPVNEKRSLFGIVDLDLDRNEIANLRELGANPPAGRWLVTRDLKLAVATARGGSSDDEQAQGVDPEVVLYTLDLETGKKVRETRVKIRNGLHLAAISPDGAKLYFIGRGHELVVYDGEHRLLKTVEMPGELDGWVMRVDS